jgi:chromosomal replication initiator protein
MKSASKRMPPLSVQGNRWRLALAFGLSLLVYGFVLASVNAPFWLFLVAPLLGVPILIGELLRGDRARETDFDLPWTGEDLEQAWWVILDRLKSSVPDSTYRLWLEPLTPVAAEDETLYLTAPEGIRTWAERRYSKLITEAVKEITGQVQRVAFVTEDGAPLHRRLAELDLNPSYTFDRFVIYPGVRLAHAAALAVAEAPFSTYNPLYLHGPPSLGRTHLLTAVANYFAAYAPSLRVRYATAESFTNDFVAALRSSGIEEFRAGYRDIDVLLVDDVQYLEGKAMTEEEFFHTFDALYEAGGQLVLSADRVPSELLSLTARLRDRFDSGLTVAMEPPDTAGRLLVLERLVREAGLEIEDADALPELASRVDANARQLHGALTRVIAHASLRQMPLTSELIAEVLPARSREVSSVSVERIQQLAADEFGVSRGELLASRRAAALRARQVAILLTRQLTDLSLPQIGRLYGGRDHSSVLNSLRRIEAILNEDPQLAERLETLHAALSEPATRR